METEATCRLSFFLSFFMNGTHAYASVCAVVHVSLCSPWCKQGRQPCIVATGGVHTAEVSDCFPSLGDDEILHLRALQRSEYILTSHCMPM